MRTAPAPGGYSQRTASSAAEMASASIISIAAGTRPAAMMAETARPALSMSEKAASNVCTAWGLRRSRTVTFVATPSVPSEPTNAPTRSYPGTSGAGPPRSTTCPSGVTTSRPVTWFVVNPYFRQWAPPEFSATLPPIEQTCWLDGSGA